MRMLRLAEACNQVGAKAGGAGREGAVVPELRHETIGNMIYSSCGDVT